MFQLVPRYYDNARSARESDVLVLCMPPSQLKSVAIQIRHALAANIEAPPLVISVLCGVTLQSLTPHREDVRELYHAFALFARRVWDQEVKLAEVLFGHQSEVVMAVLGSRADDERQKEAKTPLEAPSWPVEWEQDLAELQARLAEHALTG
ncbi:hypothetical protein BBO99_00009421 [Phytophthora kernoviae]|uniref:Uncharacterized protein n=2 Tax=Phytophthora kernoviae TaxID=325452 RepID=A0A421FAG8_9STRA|nr:hypothetical protein G195_010606 [Phytophthora kernoviae 00238/432]KAG2504659.1 hypothetical protein JM16_009314 [Phytophthora kernoviae]KAG2506956.1 hypothetical protein JM18_008968 [Phytophthora kernoviae]RLN32538.1 hypothetical protein BBI17_009455 [Phytophthora kernoviae]RLN73465.1 hypothetical protein BBO99_00009421 [Phytophthora kernoviae]